MKKSLLLITAFILSMNTYGLTMAEYNLQITKINAIEDEQMRDLIKKELAKKIANEVADSTEVKKVNETSKVEVSGEEVVTKEVASDGGATVKIEINNKVGEVAAIKAPAPTYITNESDDFDFQIGVSSIYSQVKYYDADLDLIGGELTFGGVKTFNGKHKLRLNLGFRSLEADTITLSDGVEYDIISKFEYFGAGLNTSYTYMTNKVFGIGTYAGFNYGEIESCYDGSCENYDTYIADAGIRFDVKVFAWNPYLTLGYTFYNIEDYKFDAISAYLGILNFEF